MQYRITVDNCTGPILSHYPGEQWSRITEICEDRGLSARFERRLVTDAGILDLVPDTMGYIKAGELVACPWETIAEMRG